jgi:hypothetical protein
VRNDVREHFVAIYLDGRHRPIADSIDSIGTAIASLAQPREVFPPAIAVEACALRIGHSHPIGDVTPSAEDLVMTRRLAEAGRIPPTFGFSLFRIDSAAWLVRTDCRWPISLASFGERRLIFLEKCSLSLDPERC